jgi:hypothetical protein
MDPHPAADNVAEDLQVQAVIPPVSDLEQSIIGF